MTCPSLLCGRTTGECDLVVCAREIGAFQRFRQVGGFRQLSKLDPPPRPKRKPGRAADLRNARSVEIKRLYVEELKTLDEIGQRFFLTRERVRQILKRDWDIAGTGVMSQRTEARRLDVLRSELNDRIANAVPCVACGAWVLRKQRGVAKTRTCSTECQMAWWASEERFWRRVEKTDDCWLWTGHVNPVTGYGSYYLPGSPNRSQYAHRVAYEFAKGPIPEGLTIDHLCRVRNCVNPDHLEAVSLRENVLRSPIAVAAINARKTHCPQGHPYIAGERHCGVCRGGRKFAQSVPCAATNLDGTSCRRSVEVEGDVCHIHAGRTATARWDRASA